MAVLSSIAGVKDIIRQKLEEGKTHDRISVELSTAYPDVIRGLSVCQIRRYCAEHFSEKSRARHKPQASD